MIIKRNDSYISFFNAYLFWLKNRICVLQWAGDIYCKWLGAKGGIRMNTNNLDGVIDNTPQNQNTGDMTPKTFDEMLKE